MTEQQQNPLVSVIIPIYNTVDYLSKTSNSILNQTYKEIELILVDDGSTDGSAELCDKISKTDNRVKVIHKPNEGVSSARNKGLDLATGDFLFFLDSDDWLSSNAIEELIYQSQKNNSDIVIMPCCRKINNDYQFTPNKTSFAITKSDIIMKLAKNECDFTIATNKLYSKALFTDVRFKNKMQFTEDKYVLIGLYEKANNIIYTNNACLFYFDRENSLSKLSPNNPHVLDEQETFLYLREKIKESRYIEALEINNHFYLRYLFTAYLRTYRSDWNNKKTILNKLSSEITDLFNSMPKYKWSFKEIRRYILFKCGAFLFSFFSSIK